MTQRDEAVGRVVGCLRAIGWRVGGKQSASDLRAALPPRYRDVPDALVEFLTAVRGATAPDDTAWFLSASDYAGDSVAAFRWNEWERMSAEAAGGDSVWQREVTAFWDEHIPFFLSVRDGYSYLAVALAPATVGAVVVGHEPEFEDASVVSSSLDDFFGAMIATLEGGTGSESLRRLLRGSDRGGEQAIGPDGQAHG